MTALGFTFVTFFSTLAGGLFALRFRVHLHLLLGFSAGVLMGAAFLDVLPEALALNETNQILRFWQRLANGLPIRRRTASG